MKEKRRVPMEPYSTTFPNEYDPSIKKGRKFYNGWLIPIGHEAIIKDEFNHKCTFFLKECGECRIDYQYCVGLKNCNRGTCMDHAFEKKKRIEEIVQFVKDMQIKYGIDGIPPLKIFKKEGELRHYKYMANHKLKNVILRSLK